MTSFNISCTGFNGFGQLKNLPKVITSLEELKLESLSSIESQKILLKCSWNYCAYANDNDLYVCGCFNGNGLQERRFPFEYSIKDIACTEHYCIVLLTIGIAYKINCQTFELNEINSTIIPRSTLDDRLKPSRIFGVFSAQRENELNESKDEFITHVAAGRSLSVVITNKNNVYNLPLKVYTFPSHVKIKKICCGNEHCLILTTNGDLYAFGSSSRGQLGLGTLDTEEQPILIEDLAGIKIIDVAAGGWHSAAISAFNDCYVWGWNVNGQIGLPLYETFEIVEKNGEKRTERQKCSTVFAAPVIVNLPKPNVDEADDDDENIFLQNQYHPVAVSAGTRHTVLKIDDGSIMATGWNKYGQLASDQLDKDIDHFQKIDKKISDDGQIICGDWCTFIVSRNK
ncbi:RCC1 domain-containing protein 1 [Contarinia nasturtii]|uniref:RCC1 domain-containing protein 1 n=1 Tax=Contarinia nasturtii TaxID=265458 RepID=UPI0012D3C0DD|nr:RCC1 domain-containing protein 1 [Contarinia nasturtii]